MRGALLYVGLYVIAVLPGVPLGRRAFGARHPAAYVAGAILGYAMTSLALWGAIALGTTGALAFVVAWAVALACGVALAAALRGATVPLFHWRRGDSAALAALLALTLIVAVPPFARVGQRDARGARLYRAYFTADFVWHMALTAEIGKFEMPPRNPYLASEPIHYYWSYFLVPATIASRGPTPVRFVERSLKVNACASALLLVSAVFLLARAAVPRAGPAAVATALVIVASSAEGVYGIWRLLHDGRPLEHLRDLNIDALSNWYFQGLRVDGLPRCFWYVPQHSMAYAGGVIALLVAVSGGATASIGTILVAGLALGASVMNNPFVGGVFAIGYGATILFRALPAREWRGVMRHLLAALPVVAAVWWCAANQMLEGAGGTVQFGMIGYAARRPLWNLLLSLGPALVPALAGLWPRRDLPCRAALPALVMLPIGLALMHLVRLSVDASWVGFRAGQILLVTMPALIARTAADLTTAGWRRMAAGALLILAFAVGLPETIIDWRNARDTANRGRGPGFAWTIAVTPAEQDAFRWIQRATAIDAIVQMEPIARGRETWSLIPSFAGRRMAAGLPISLLNVPAYREGSATVRQMFSTMDALEAHQIARTLGIDYIYADRVERRAYPEGVAKFAARPELFAPVFANSEVVIYGVR